MYRDETLLCMYRLKPHITVKPYPYLCKPQTAPHRTTPHQGAMCKCFVAQGNPQFQGPVVLKLAIENGPREAERDLNRELSLLHNLSHPNLTALLGSGQTPKGKT